MFEVGFFRSNPEPFYELAKQLFPKELNPTLAHNFVKLLHNKGLLLRHYTQACNSDVFVYVYYKMISNDE